MREYHEVFDHELPSLPRGPVLSDFYTPNDKQHYRDLGFHSIEYDWNRRSFILFRELNYITSCNITIF